MSVRWKLNLSVLALIAVFLVAVAFAMRAVGENAQQTRLVSRMRALSQFTADVRTDIFRHLSAVPVQGPGALGATAAWPASLVEDIDVQIHLSQGDEVQELWESVRQRVLDLDEAAGSSGDSSRVSPLVAQVERELRRLRDLYDLREHDLVAGSAETSLAAQVAIWIACALTVLLFLIYLIMVRHWLVRPIRILKKSADIIGSGRLDHRVALAGRDELAGLARALESMAGRLARHQAELLESRELSAIGELCTHVAHGLKNPLAAIRASAQLAERRAGGCEPVQARIRELVAQADCMNARISELFEFSRPFDLSLEQVCFRDLAEDVGSLARGLLETRGITLRIEDCCAGIACSLDRRRMTDVLAELICNASHHSPQRSEIILRGTPSSQVNGKVRRLIIDVIDHGNGMTAATRQKAFDLFFTSRVSGTGMGLAMVRRVVHKHGGQIELQSEPGLGTTVTIVLPGLDAATHEQLSGGRTE